MTREQEIAALDQLIDTLRASAPAALDDVTDPELGSLLATVLELRRLAEPGWPDADFPAVASARIAQRLLATADKPRRAKRLSVSAAAPNGYADGLAKGAWQDRLLERRVRRHWFWESAQMAAAVLVLVLVGGLLMIVLSGRGALPTRRLGSQPAASSPQGGATSQPKLRLHHLRLRNPGRQPLVP